MAERGTLGVDGPPDRSLGRSDGHPAEIIRSDSRRPRSPPAHDIGARPHSLITPQPGRARSAAAPPGEDTLIAVVPVGHLDAPGKQDWRRIRARARQAVFDRLALLGIADLQAHLKFEVNYVPVSWRKRYNLMQGATHGLAHTLTQLGYLRPHNRHARYHNLYFVGASTHPGTGVPTALICARMVADRIAEDWLAGWPAEHLA